MIVERFGFGRSIAAIGFGSLQTIAGSGETRIVRVEISGKTCLDARRVGEFRSSSFKNCSGLNRDKYRFFSTTGCFIECSACRART